MNYYFRAMQKYAVFRGRATRSEFWFFYLFYMIGGIALVILDRNLFAENEEGARAIPMLWALAHILPGMAVLVRRLHDIDRTGWWFLINITGIGTFVLLIFAMLRGTEGPNRFGPAPSDLAAYDEPYPAYDRGPQRIDPGVGQYHPNRGPDRVTAYPQAPQRVAASADPADVIGDIERLAKLRDSGGLTEAEFEVMKAQALARISRA